MDKYGEEYSGDSKFVADCRLLQSMYRVEIGEAIRPYKSRDGKTHYYGNYIEGGEESGKNFLTEHAFSYAKYRVENKQKHETIESDRLFNNLLSSQSMAFNLFCPLQKLRSEAPQEATRAIQSALPHYDIALVKEVALEFIPEKYKDITGDKSAMDAIIRYVDSEGKDCFTAIETKYSESLGANEAADKATKEQERRVAVELGIFRDEAAEKIASGDVPLTQIYRNFLLSEAYGNRYGLASYSIILSPSIHPSTEREVDSLLPELKEEYAEKLRIVHLEDFVDALIANTPEEYSSLFDRFRSRYLDFDKARKTL